MHFFAFTLLDSNKLEMLKRGLSSFFALTVKIRDCNKRVIALTQSLVCKVVALYSISIGNAIACQSNLSSCLTLVSAEMKDFVSLSNP
jgi:hypothetical protein